MSHHRHIIVRSGSRKPGFDQGKPAPGVTHGCDVQPVLELFLTEEFEGTKLDDFHVGDGGPVSPDQDAVDGPDAVVNPHFRLPTTETLTHLHLFGVSFGKLSVQLRERMNGIYNIPHVFVYKARCDSMHEDDV